MTTGNQGLDALADAIAARVYERIRAAQGRDEKRVYTVAEAATYLGRSAKSVRHLIATRALPSTQRDGRVMLDREDLDRWIELGKA